MHGPFLSLLDGMSTTDTLSQIPQPTRNFLQVLPDSLSIYAYSSCHLSPLLAAQLQPPPYTTAVHDLTAPNHSFRRCAAYPIGLWIKACRVVEKVRQVVAKSVQASVLLFREWRENAYRATGERNE